jgi:hypothetical protein
VAPALAAEANTLTCAYASPVGGDRVGDPATEIGFNLQGKSGAPGHVYFEAQDDIYRFEVALRQELLEHLGGLKPGESKPIPEFPPKGEVR